MRSFRVWFLYSFVALAITEPCLGQADSAKQLVEDVQGKLMVQLQQLEERHYQQYGPQFMLPIPSNVNQHIIIQLTADTDYAIVAACDSMCHHLSVSFSDEAGNRLVATSEIVPTQVVMGTVPSTGLYSFELGVPGCTAKACFVGVIMTRKGQ